VCNIDVCPQPESPIRFCSNGKPMFYSDRECRDRKTRNIGFVDAVYLGVQENRAKLAIAGREEAGLL